MGYIIGMENRYIYIYGLIIMNQQLVESPILDWKKKKTSESSQGKQSTHFCGRPGELTHNHKIFLASKERPSATPTNISITEFTSHLHIFIPIFDQPILPTTFPNHVPIDHHDFLPFFNGHFRYLN